MSEIKPNDTAAAEDNGEETDWAAAKAFFDNLKTHKPRPVSIFLLALSSRVSRTQLSRKAFKTSSSTARRFMFYSLPFHSLSAQTPVCCHHRCLLSHPLQHGGREEALRRRRSGEVRGLSGGARKRAPETRSCFPFRQGTVGLKNLCRLFAGRGPLSSFTQLKKHVVDNSPHHDNKHKP